MKRTISGGRPKVKSDQFMVRTTASIGQLIRAGADEAEMSYGDFILMHAAGSLGCEPPARPQKAEGQMDLLDTA